MTWGHIAALATIGAAIVFMGIWAIFGPVSCGKFYASDGQSWICYRANGETYFSYRLNFEPYPTHP